MRSAESCRTRSRDEHADSSESRAASDLSEMLCRPVKAREYSRALFPLYLILANLRVNLHLFNFRMH